MEKNLLANVNCKKLPATNVSCDTYITDDIQLQESRRFFLCSQFLEKMHFLATVFFSFFKDFYLFERESEHEKGRDRQREKEKRAAC